MFVLNKMLGWWLDLFGSGDKAVAGFCDNNDENSGTMKDGNFFISSKSISFLKNAFDKP